MNEWEIFRNRDYKKSGESVSVPLLFHEVLEVIKETDLAKKDLKIKVNRLEYLPFDKKDQMVVYSDLDRCFFKGEKLDGPLLLLLFRLGSLSFRICR